MNYSRLAYLHNFEPKKPPHAVMKFYCRMQEIHAIEILTRLFFMLQSIFLSLRSPTTLDLSMLPKS